ncbi:MAG: hypothetical protein WAS33_11100 [Candidatus Promineifilaceae bacterium]
MILRNTHQPLGGSEPPGGLLNNALTAWWDLGFPTFRAQIKKVFKRDIPLKERHEWELFLADAQQQHQQLTSQIITLETELNQHVYTLFHLTPEEIQIIETSTKYPYGEV